MCFSWVEPGNDVLSEEDHMTDVPGPCDVIASAECMIDTWGPGDTHLGK